MKIKPTHLKDIASGATIALDLKTSATDVVTISAKDAGVAANSYSFKVGIAAEKINMMVANQMRDWLRIFKQSQMSNLKPMPNQIHTIRSWERQRKLCKHCDNKTGKKVGKLNYRVPVCTYCYIVVCHRERCNITHALGCGGKLNAHACTSERL